MGYENPIAFMWRSKIIGGQPRSRSENLVNNNFQKEDFFWGETSNVVI